MDYKVKDLVSSECNQVFQFGGIDKRNVNNYNSDANAVPIDNVTAFAVRKRFPRLIVDDVGHKPRE